MSSGPPGAPGTPVTPPAIPGALVRAMCGPLLLITLGALLAIDYADKASFWRTWPALLIVLGLCKLAERAAA